MIRRIPAPTLRARSPASKAPLTGVENAIRVLHPGSTITVIETESPMDLPEELKLPAPIPNSKPAAFVSAMHAAIKAWEAMSEEERVAVGYVRYFFHPSGAVQVQPIGDPRKAKKGLRI